MEDVKDIVFKVVQEFLCTTPLIIWGSGATVPCGLPTMGCLAKHLKDTMLPDLELATNLEAVLGESKYEPLQSEIKRRIWEYISTYDVKFLESLSNGNEDAYVAAIGKLLDKFTFAHPRKLDIVTTNYDRVLEYICSLNNMCYADGTGLSDLSIFDSNRFKNEKCVNIIKVHGSLSWFEIDGDIRNLSKGLGNVPPVIIIPGKNKYRESSQIPYRELIQKCDIAVDSAKSFLSIGFGFNDEHITPEIIKSVNKGAPIVVVTMRVSETCRAALKKASQYVLIEASSANDRESLVTIKQKGLPNIQELVLEGCYWSLPKFMEIFI